MVNVTRYLIKCGLDIHAKTCKGDTILMLLCCANGNPQRVESKGEHALHYICRLKDWFEYSFFELNQIDSIAALVHAGVDINVLAKNGVDNALHTLCRFNSTSSCFYITPSTRILECLIKRGIDVNARDVTGDTPLFTWSVASSGRKCWIHTFVN